MEKQLAKQSEEEQLYSRKMLAMFGIGNGSMAFVKKQSIRNQFYSDLVTPLQDNISAAGTAIHCFYAVKMGEKYEERYKKHFKSPDIRRHDFQHEELLICRPDEWAQEVINCCGV